MAVHLRKPFPPECRGREINGVDLVLLDADTYGIATWYEDNDDALTDAHRGALTQLLGEFDLVQDLLPTEDAQAYYANLRDLGQYLVEIRGDRPRTAEQSAD